MVGTEFFYIVFAGAGTVVEGLTAKVVFTFINPLAVDASALFGLAEPAVFADAGIAVTHDVERLCHVF